LQLIKVWSRTLQTCLTPWHQLSQPAISAAINDDESVFLGSNRHHHRLIGGILFGTARSAIIISPLLPNLRDGSLISDQPQSGGRERSNRLLIHVGQLGIRKKIVNTSLFRPSQKDRRPSISIREIKKG
jgi:hypothetical protein